MTKPEQKFLRLLILCASPDRTLPYRSASTGSDATGNPYTFLINKLVQQGYLSTDFNMIKILDEPKNNIDT